MVGVFGSCPYATIASGNGDKTMNRVSDERDGQEARPVPESEHLILPRQPWKDLVSYSNGLELPQIGHVHEEKTSL